MTARAHLLPSQAPAERRAIVTYSTVFAGLVAAYLLVIVGRMHEVFPALQPLRLGMVTSIVMVIGAFQTLRGDLLRLLFTSGPGRAFLVVTAFVFLTVPTGAWPSASVAYIRTVYYQMAILFVVTSLLFIDRRASRVVIFALVVEVAIAGLFARFLGAAGRFGIGITYDENETASLFALMIPWAIYVGVTERGWKRLIGILAIPLYLYGVVKTGSRGGLLGVGAMVPFLIYLSPPKRRLPFAVAIIVAALATSLSLNERAIRRFRMAFDTNEYNYQLEDGRINIWKRGIGYIVSKPIQGVGINGFQFQELATKKNTGFGIRQAAAHNMYIQVASELGLIGFGGFVAMIWLAWRGCTRVRKRLRPLILQGSDPELRAELLRANMAQAAILSVLFTGFFLSLGYSAMLFFSVAAAIGIGLGGGLTGPVTGHPAPTFQQPPRRGGQRGWRSARPVPTISRADSSTPGA